uniref:Uncharacterized protein n=1 Tax=Chromera velia CCMP2878 TaxID=1169474 RepID=A0A0G4HDF0_9ALVE|eukprot:Cvel_6435.t1-p1 / transcript=Cvel_6435.t1 / gene=Cvel_6435 / organism=Chromera_velia_CCMP2878 / gene_product=hypothetical protein / transcript_product=hypothetical protein / location=Cvel_scaffold315:21639-25225(+) / protein_length=804 / sequence_SO=supercontig / SO=protein_coding / is_pseudo=false
MQGKVQVPLSSLDLSRWSNTLSPSKLFLLLFHSLPASIDRLTLGPTAIRDAPPYPDAHFLEDSKSSIVETEELMSDDSEKAKGKGKNPLSLLCRFLKYQCSSSFCLSTSKAETEDHKDCLDNVHHGAEESFLIRPTLCLKELIFAGKSMGKLEAARIFPLLPSSLRSLNLAGNEIGSDGLAALADGFRFRLLAFLSSLVLDNIGMDSGGVETLCRAFLESGSLEGSGGGLSLERLSLSDNNFGDLGIEALSPVWEGQKTSNVFSLTYLGLARCGFSGVGMKRLSEAMRCGKMKNLQSLDLEGNQIAQGGSGSDLGGLTGVIKMEFLPFLKELNLTGVEGVGSMSASALLKVLTSEDHPPLERVFLRLESLGVQESSGLGRALCGGEGGRGEKEEGVVGDKSRLSFLQTLSLVKLSTAAVVAFLREITAASVSPSCGALELEVGGFAETQDPPQQQAQINAQGGGGEMGGFLPLSAAVGALGVSLRSGKVSGCLRKLKVVGGAGSRLSEEERRELMRSLTNVALASLSDLELRELGLGDVEIALLADGVRGGGFGGVRMFSLVGNTGVGREGMMALMEAVIESSIGFCRLEILDLSRTRAGEGIGCLVDALRSGRMISLRDLRFRLAGVSDEGMRALGEGVKEGHFSRLVNLEIAESDFGGSGMEGFFLEGICKASLGLPELESLDLGVSRAGEGMEALSSALGDGKLPKLADLQLANCGVDDSGLGAFAEALKKNDLPALTFLRLSRNVIGKDAMTSFVEGLRPDSLPNLKGLSLWGNSFRWGEVRDPLKRAKREGKLKSVRPS